MANNHPLVFIVVSLFLQGVQKFILFYSSTTEIDNIFQWLLFYFNLIRDVMNKDFRSLFISR